MSAESPRHVRSGGPLTVPSQPPSDRSIIDAVSGFINDVTLSSSSNVDPKDVIQWARFETADINEPTQEGDGDDISPLLLILGYGSGVQVWLIPPTGEAQEVLSWRQGTVRVLRILPTPQHGDCFASKRPLIALCDSISPGPSFCSLSFISIRGGEQVKNIKFKNQILDVLANKRSIVVSFSERFAVFDAGSLEDRLTVTTCYPCPCPLGGASPINPLALGDRWIAYADKKLNPSKRSSGGCEGEGVTSYTATVLHAAKSLSKGLRGLGETVAQSLAGGRTTSQSPSPPNTDIQQPGVITILDIEGYEDEDMMDGEEPCDPMVAHFIAHSEAIIALKFDASGMLLVTADRRGHDFHVFRINPHPCGPSLASVHHLYILHRGDTTAKVQDIAISGDSRWAAVSTLRGTTHVFAVSPYGGACGVRTHTQPRVVNRLSRFQRSAGLPIHAPTHRSGSPVGDGMSQGAWFPNPRLPPYPMPVTALPLAQLRPTANLPTHTITRTSSGRQRLSSVSEEGTAPLLARAWLGAGGAGAGGGARAPAAAPLHLMAASGALLHLVLHPRPARNVPKEKISDESPIEVEVEAVAQWPLQRPPAAADLLAPLPPSNPLLQQVTCRRCSDVCLSEEERWLSQVEILTHAGPHRRLWMGPQFVFKTYTTTGSNSSLSEAETVEVEANAARSVARSNPVNMPGSRPLVPVIVDSGSASSLEHSPSDSYRRRSLLSETGRTASVSDVQLREDLAEAMKEDHGRPREGAEVRRAGVVRAVGPAGTVVAPAPAPAPPPARDHALPNADEARFCAVRAARLPAAAPAPAPAAGVTVRALPRDTTLPVQRAPAQPPPAHPAPHPVPLLDAVVIPVALDAPPDAADLPFDRFRSDRESEPEFVFDSHVVANLTDVNVNEDLKCGENDDSVDESERECVSAKPVERVSSEALALPKSNRSSDDIQPTAAVRSKKSPTPKSVGDKNVSEVSIKNAFSVDIEKPKKSNKNKDDDSKSKIDKKSRNKEANVSVEPIVEIGAKDVVKIKKEETKGATELKVKENTDYPELTKQEVIVTKDVKKEEIRKNKQLKHKETKIQNEINLIKETEVDQFDIELPNIIVDKQIFNKKEQEMCDIVKRDDLVNIELELPVKNALEFEVIKPNHDIKTEEQAWDLLLNEPNKPSASDKIFDTKPKSKKNRRKIQDDVTGKADKDSFIEIHAIEDKQQSSSVLVSISTPFDDMEPLSYLPKTKKSRSPKSVTPERKVGCERKRSECNYEQETEFIDISSKKCPAGNDFSTLDVDVVSETYTLQMSKSSQKGDKAFKVIESSENIATDISSSSKVQSKTKKSKSLSPFQESRKLDKNFETDTKDVYVINTMDEDFPEIQITRATKARKKSPQPEERHSEERESVYDKPVISWSSIAASKSVKKAEEIETETTEVLKTDTEVKSEKRKFQEENPESSKKILLQQKLFELCKRTDIMIAECDALSELNFVEEHHAVMEDLPPLEPLDFGLDDFKLEVMRDSLLDVNDPKTASPICKINIDDILSSIKETTSKAIETSMFNLVDLEKVPGKKEKGFSVIDSHKITTQELKLDDESKSSEKSSDEEPSAVLSADSDKDDKKTTDPDKVVQPSLKQSSKSKKPRRKKK